MKHNEQRLSSITELTTIEDSNSKPIKLLDTGQRDKERDKDNRDREREWNYKSISQNQITNNHQQPVVNHASHVSRFYLYWRRRRCRRQSVLTIYELRVSLSTKFSTANIA